MAHCRSGCLCTLLGIYADRHLGTKPWLTLLSVAVGFGWPRCLLNGSWRPCKKRKTSMNSLFASTTPEVSVAPETLFHLGPFPVTNSHILGLLGVSVILLLMFGTVRALKRGSRSRLMHMVLWAFESLYDTTVEVIGDKQVARKVMPLAVTLLFFFLVNNWLGILPFVGSITYGHHPLFRGAAADMNMTFALAIISMTTAQVWAIKKHGFFGNIGRYLINPFKDPLHSFEGALEIVAEFFAYPGAFLAYFRERLWRRGAVGRHRLPERLRGRYSLTPVLCVRIIRWSRAGLCVLYVDGCVYLFGPAPGRCPSRARCRNEQIR